VIAVPTIVGGAAQGNPGPLVANPGDSVSIRAETNLKLAVLPGFQELCRLQALH
jgi:hypothetical protein